MSLHSVLPLHEMPLTSLDNIVPGTSIPSVTDSLVANDDTSENSRRLLRSCTGCTVSSPLGRANLQSRGKEVLDVLGEAHSPKPKSESWFCLTSVNSRRGNCDKLYIEHSPVAYAAARLPTEYWLGENSDEPDEELLRILESVGVKVAAWEQTTWFGEQVAVLLLFCTFAADVESGLHVVKAMVTLNKLGIHTCHSHQELNNIAARQEICPWEQLLFMWYVWTGVLEYRLGWQKAKSILRLTPALWGVHDEACNSEIWRVCRSGAPLHWCECFRNPHACAYRLWAWLNIDLRPVEVAMYDTIRVVHGTDIAVYFVFVSSVIRSLGFLSIMVLPFVVWEARSRHKIDCPGPDCFKSSYVKVGRPMLALLLCLWSCHFLKRWGLVYDALCHRWHIKESSEFQRYLPYSREEVRESFKPSTYPIACRAVRTLLLLPCVCLCWLLISAMLGCTLWLEMWIVYEWADCRDQNRMTGEAGSRPSCDGAAKKYGFFGDLVEVVPGLLQGVLFEIGKVFAYRCGNYVCNLQNWRTNTQYRTAFELQVYGFEFISKFCVIGALAFYFVPDWQNHNRKYWTVDAGDCKDLLGGTYSWACLQIRTPYHLRLKLLQQSMVGCFIVAPIVSILTTCLVPYLFRSCVLCGANKYLRFFWLWRLLLVMFYYEEDALGGCCAYVLTGKERPAHNLRKDGVALSSTEVPLTWSSVVRQAYQKAFQPSDGYIDLLLHVNFIATFGVVFPLGAIVNLLIVMLRLRGEVFMLLFEKQRRLNQYSQQTEDQQTCIHMILVCQLMVAVLFNSLLLTLPFRTLEHWAPKRYQHKPLDSILDDLVLCCCSIVVCFAFVLLVLKDVLHFLPMPPLQFVQEWRQHVREQHIDLDHALRRDCHKALQECTAIRIQAQKEREQLRRELKKAQWELAELCSWQSTLCSDGQRTDTANSLPSPTRIGFGMPSAQQADPGSP